MNNNYNKNLKQFARSNRRDGTRAEIKLWIELLRNKQMMGYSFLRLRPIANYIADFFSKELNLIIEVDGLSHSWEENTFRDNKRDETLSKLGYQTLRFSDDEVMKDIDNVRRTIENLIMTLKKSHPLPPSKGDTIV